jgi:hypothetical protein
MDRLFALVLGMEAGNELVEVVSVLSAEETLQHIC